MIKFKHLPAKIRHVRNRLGLKQKDFILEISERLGRGETPLSQGLVSQWESGKTTPTAPQLCAIARRTKQPWRTMAWLMHDDLPANRGVNYHPDGTFHLLPKSVDADMHEIFTLLEDQSDNDTVAGFLTAWEEDPNKIYSIRDKLQGHIDQEEFDGNSDEAKEDKNAGGKDVTVTLTGVEAKTEAGSIQTNQEKKEKQTAMMGGLAQLMRMRLDQFVPFPESIFEYSSPSAAGDEESDGVGDDRIRRRQNFDETVRYFINQAFRSQDAKVGFDRVISSGPIRSRPYFYLYGVSAVREMLEPSTLVLNIPNMISKRLGQLLLIDRLQGKSAKKLLVFCIYEAGIDLTRLREMHEHYIKSAKALGITIAFTSGAAESAGEITSLIASPGVDV